MLFNSTFVLNKKITLAFTFFFLIFLEKASCKASKQHDEWIFYLESAHSTRLYGKISTYTCIYSRIYPNYDCAIYILFQTSILFVSNPCKRKFSLGNLLLLYFENLVIIYLILHPELINIYIGLLLYKPV